MSKVYNIFNDDVLVAGENVPRLNVYIGPELSPVNAKISKIDCINKTVTMYVTDNNNETILIDNCEVYTCILKVKYLYATDIKTHEVVIQWGTEEKTKQKVMEQNNARS